MCLPSWKRTSACSAWGQRRSANGPDMNDTRNTNPMESPHAGRGRRLSAMLRAGEAPTDRDFDEVYPPSIQALSATFWTPVDIAIRAARLLALTPGARVLDIGSGVGKFCIIGALTTPGAYFGVEQRSSLVSAAREAAALFGANIAFTHGLFSERDPKDYDAFYFFNPFGENMYAPTTQIDGTVELTVPRFVEDVWRAHEFLAAAKPGARVVTYNGMGGEPPYAFTRMERDYDAGIDLWVKEF